MTTRTKPAGTDPTTAITESWADAIATGAEVGDRVLVVRNRNGRNRYVVGSDKTKAAHPKNHPWTDYRVQMGHDADGKAVKVLTIVHNPEPSIPQLGILTNTKGVRFQHGGLVVNESIGDRTGFVAGALREELRDVFISDIEPVVARFGEMRQARLRQRASGLLESSSLAVGDGVRLERDSAGRVTVYLDPESRRPTDNWTTYRIAFAQTETGPPQKVVLMTHKGQDGYPKMGIISDTRHVRFDKDGTVVVHRSMGGERAGAVIGTADPSLLEQYDRDSDVVDSAFTRIVNQRTMLHARAQSLSPHLRVQDRLSPAKVKATRVIPSPAISL